MGNIKKILKRAAVMCLRIKGKSLPTGKITKVTENKMMEINKRKKIKEVPQRGWRVVYFLAFSTINSSLASNVEMDLCSAPWY